MSITLERLLLGVLEPDPHKQDINTLEKSMESLPDGGPELQESASNNLDQEIPEEFHDTISSMLERFAYNEDSGVYELSMDNGLSVRVKAFGYGSYGESPLSLPSTFPAHIAHPTIGEEGYVHFVAEVSRPYGNDEYLRNETTILFKVPLIQSEEFTEYPNGDVSELSEIDPENVRFVQAEHDYRIRNPETGRLESETYEVGINDALKQLSYINFDL